MTNYEKIKAMSIEEMAEAMNDKTHGCLLEFYCPCDCGYDMPENCVAAITHWLESEVEEND